MSKMLVTMLRTALNKLNPNEISDVVAKALIGEEDSAQSKKDTVRLCCSILSKVTYRGYKMQDDNMEKLEKEFHELIKKHVGD